MPSVEWHREAHLDASPDDVYAWLADPQEDDHATPAYLRGAGLTHTRAPPARREILQREERHITLRDHWGPRRFDVVAHLHPETREIRLESAHNYRSVWKATPEGNGTHLSVTGSMQPKGILALLIPLFRKRLLTQMAHDFDGHLEDARQTLATKTSRP